jgi:signal transduction histidine kinase
MSVSLRAQLMRRLVWPMLALTLAGGWVSYFMALKFARNAYDQTLLDTAVSVAREVEYVNGGLHLDLPRQAQDLLEWDPHDRIYFRVDTDQDGLIAGSPDLIPPDSRGRDVLFQDGWVRGKEVRLVTISTTNNGQGVRVAVAETLNKRKRLAKEVLVTVVIPQLLLIGLAVLLIRTGIRRGLTPIADLEQAVNSRTPGDLRSLPEGDVPKELRPFTRAINGLMARLGKSIESQNRFIADAAHQMRTPLAAIKVQLERAQREPDREGQAEALRQTLATLDRTSRLSNQLLTLARAEARPNASSHYVRLDLRSVTFDVGVAWVPKALAQGADLGFADPRQEVPVVCDQSLLAEAVNNLIDNALRYAGPSPKVTLGVLPADGDHGAILFVEDDGPGIPVPEREAVLERFYRVPGSPGSGSGLGLSIVRVIIQAHGGDITFKDPDHGGFQVGLVFPVSGARNTPAP